MDDTIMEKDGQTGTEAIMDKNDQLGMEDAVEQASKRRPIEGPGGSDEGTNKLFKPTAVHLNTQSSVLFAISSYDRDLPHSRIYGPEKWNRP